MDAYPNEYIAHNYPLILLSGLTSTSEDSGGSTHSRGPLIKSNLPLVQNDRKEELLHDFLQLAGNDEDWSGKHLRLPNPVVGYRFKPVGREYRFPPRKADPPTPQVLSRANSLKDDDDKTSKQPPQWVLHSPLSPLTPTSPLYPDGVFDSAWIRKYQEEVPCLFIAFFDFTSDSERNSLNDNQLKTEISEIRSALAKSEYKTRLAVVLLSDKQISQAADIEDRLATIRRATGLDPKTGLFFLPPNLSRVEVTSFVATLIHAVQPQCVEYYRDLTKHARRKKNRGNVPAPTVLPTTASQALASYGWGIRYDIKQGVFAEFRQEMEAACRHYTSALEALMGSEGTFETTASWSPRWDEARIISDMMAFRIIRCLLWSRMGTTATQSWVNYRDRMRELVDRKGKGSENYGWEAWETRWAKLMAQLIQRADVPAFNMLDSIDLTESAATQRTASGNSTYLLPEKTIPANEKIAPWHHLHHPGYWMRLSARNASRRRRYALKIPEEDRKPPGQSPASAVAHRSGTYDTYLCLEPHEEYPVTGVDGFDHAADLLDRLQIASSAYKERGQKRFDERLRLEMGRELLRTERYQEGIEVLKPLWETCTWRKERWWMPLFELTRMLGECAKGAGDVDLLAATVFELHTPYLRLLRDMKLDLMHCGQGLKKSRELEEGEKPIVRMSADSVVSFLNTSFFFASADGHVGETARAQLRVFSEAHSNTAPLTFSKIRACFKPDRYCFEISHSTDKASETVQAGSRSISLVDISNSKTATVADNGNVLFSAQSDLTFYPGRRTVWLLGFDVRDPGELELESLEFEIEADDFHLVHTISSSNFSSPHQWFLSGPNGVLQKRLGRDAPWIIEIHPKPPKLDVQIRNIDHTFHTDELVNLEFEITNAEEEAVTPQIDIRLVGQEEAPQISWLNHIKEDTDPNTTDPDNANVYSVPSLSPGESTICTAVFTAPATPDDLILETKIHYSLPSEPDMPLSKTYSANLNITPAFEANYDFTPRVHPEPWPSFFAIDRPMPGLLQRWCLSAHLASCVAESVHVKKLSLSIDQAPKGLKYSVINEQADSASSLAPRAMRSHDFLIDTTRPVVKEHRAGNMTAHLHITWARTAEASPDVTSRLPVSPLALAPLEPRIIASAQHNTLAPSSSSPTTPPTTAPPPATPATTPLTQLTLTLENPSQHPLIFDVSAPSSEALAFSGPKQQGVTLLPYSRVAVKYRLLPLVRGGVWLVFGVKVADRYFVREVPVLAGEGVGAAEEGGVRWWVE